MTDLVLSAIFPLLFLQSFAFGKSLPWSLVPWDLGRVFWGMVSFGLVWLLLGKKRYVEGKVERILENQISLRLWLMCNLIYLISSHFLFINSGYPIPWIAIIFVLLVAPQIRFERPIFSILVNVTLLFTAIIEFPLDIQRSDMLVVTQNALDSWGRRLDPYAIQTLEGYSSSYGYLPGIFLSHLPAWLLGIDLRWNNLVFRALWLFLLLRMIWKSKNPEAKIAFHYLALSPYINFRHELYFEAFLFFLVAYFAIPKMKYFCFSLMIITLQWSWVLAPFLLLNEIRSQPKNFIKISMNYALSALLVGLGIYWILTPVVAWKSMLERIFWFQKVVEDVDFYFDFGPNFKWLFMKLGILHWMQKIQAITVATLFFGVLIQKLRGPVLYWGAVALILFIMLNGHYWLYFWNIPIVFCVLVATTQDASADKISWPSPVDPVSK